MNNLNFLLTNASRTIVGKLCRQAEILIDSTNNLETKEKLNLLKSFNKELIYQEFRDITNQLSSSNGQKEYKIFKAPTKS